MTVGAGRWIKAAPVRPMPAPSGVSLNVDVVGIDRQIDERPGGLRQPSRECSRTFQTAQHCSARRARPPAPRGHRETLEKPYRGVRTTRSYCDNTELGKAVVNGGRIWVLAHFSRAADSSNRVLLLLDGRVVTVEWSVAARALRFAGKALAFALFQGVALTMFQIVLPLLVRSWRGAVDCLVDLGRPEQVSEEPIIERPVQPARESAQLSTVLVPQHGYQPPRRAACL